MSESDRAASNDRDRHERQLQQANDFHGVLLAMAGHDLRQPLQSIVGAYDWLARRLGSSSEQEYLRRGRLAIAQLTDQFDLLIEALRMHEHSVDIQPTPVVLGPILVRLCRESKDIAEHEDLTLRANPTRAVAMSDAVLLQGILRNLIRNAVKYTGPGGQVVVGCRRRGTLLKIEVHDNGIGIPPDKLSEIFEAFRRLDSNSRRWPGPRTFRGQTRSPAFGSRNRGSLRDRPGLMLFGPGRGRRCRGFTRSNTLSRQRNPISGTRCEARRIGSLDGEREPERIPHRNGGRMTSRSNSGYLRKPKRFDSTAPRPRLPVAAGSARWRERRAAAQRPLLLPRSRRRRA